VDTTVLGQVESLGHGFGIIIIGVNGEILELNHIIDIVPNNIYRELVFIIFIDGLEKFFACIVAPSTLMPSLSPERMQREPV